MIEIQPIKDINCSITAPGSKSLTQRALIAAALADGTTQLNGPLSSEDTQYTSEALRAMGISMTIVESSWQVNGKAGIVATPSEPIFLGNNGTATRFLTSVAALGQGKFDITGGPRMEERPIDPLISALQGWGVQISSVKNTGCPPLEINAQGINGGKTVLPEGKSSQYLSSLLLVAPYAKQAAQLEVRGEVFSKPYVLMTLDVMKDFGIDVESNHSLTEFTIPQGKYLARDYQVEGDASSASYFWAAAAVTGGSVTVVNVPDPSLQGDAELVTFLEKMGCTISKQQSGITVKGPTELQAIEVDMADCPDVAPTLAVVASFARGRTIIKNIAHLRIKECDRLHVMATELAKLGIKTEEGPDYLIIDGDPSLKTMHGAHIETYEDHRIAMCFAVAGLKIPGVKVLGEKCVVKSFPDFWERFSLLYK